jgi:hypothetical protein
MFIEHKNPIKSMAETITRKTKGKTKERPKDAQPARTKKGRELPSCGKKLSHPQPF